MFKEMSEINVQGNVQGNVYKQCSRKCTRKCLQIMFMEMYKETFKEMFENNVEGYVCNCNCYLVNPMCQWWPTTQSHHWLVGACVYTRRMALAALFTASTTEGHADMASLKIIRKSGHDWLRLSVKPPDMFFLSLKVTVFGKTNWTEYFGVQKLRYLWTLVY